MNPKATDSQSLRIRRGWKLIGLPFNFIASVLVYLLFDVTWQQAWRGEL